MAPAETLSPLDLDAALERVSAGEALSVGELTRLAESPDILPIGMLADAVRRRVAGTRVTFLRVALVDAAQLVATAAVSPAAHEVRLTGSPETLEVAAGCVAAVKAEAGVRTVSGFSWVDIDRWASANGGHLTVLAFLRDAGLDAVAELPLDLDDRPERSVTILTEAGFRDIRLTIAAAAPIRERLQHLLRAASLTDRFPGIAAVAPLPMSLNPLRPTTGYDDVKAVALARLAMPGVPHVQVDWLLYGPKLAQVALTFGADDIDNVSQTDAAPDGRRRAPVEELRRNVESAGFTAVERDGRFATLA
jgi:aminodeoxyfutalosine synthase